MLKYSFIILISIELTSCGIYRQNVINVPLMESSGQTQIGGYFSFNGYDGQVSYALTNNIVLVANYNDLGIKRDVAGYNYSIDKHNFGEVGAGYFTRITEEWIGELFVIAGKGKTSHFFTGIVSYEGPSFPVTYFNEAKYDRYLIQTDFGTIRGKWQYAFSPRIFLIHYYDIKDNSSKEFNKLPNKYIYSEGVLTLKYSVFEYLKATGQAGLTLPITGYDAAYFEASPFNCSIGLILDMDLF